MLLSAISVKRMSGEIPDQNDLKTKKKELSLEFLTFQYKKIILIMEGGIS